MKWFFLTKDQKSLKTHLKRHGEHIASKSSINKKIKKDLTLREYYYIIYSYGCVIPHELAEA